MTKWTWGYVVLCGLLVGAGSLEAHHSLAASYALAKEGEVSGAFKGFRLVNPHSSMKLDVKNADGTTTEWTFTGGGASTLARLGIGRSGPNALDSGDMVTVTYTPAADGKSPLGLLKAITYPDGHVVQFRVD